MNETFTWLRQVLRLTQKVLSKESGSGKLTTHDYGSVVKRIVQSCLNVGEIDQFEVWLKSAPRAKEVKIEIFTITLLYTVLKCQGNRISCKLNLNLTFLSSIKMRKTCLHVSKIGIDGLYKAGNYLNYLHFALDGTAPPMISILISFTFFALSVGYIPSK